MANKVSGLNRGSLTDAVKGLFKPGTDFRGANNSLLPEFAPLGYGINNYYDARKMKLEEDFQGVGTRNVRDKRTREVYRATKNSFMASFNQKGAVTLGNNNDGLGIVALQLNGAAHYVDTAMDQWKNVITKFALEVFKESFSMKRFNSKDSGRRWKGLMPSTKKMRKAHGLWPGQNKVLEATGKLKGSLIREETPNGYMITEKPVDDVVYKKNGKYTRKRIYAGIHNDPRFFGAVAYTNGTPYTRRRFMGHSTKIDQFISSYQDRYLFDNVIRIPTR